MGGFMFPWGRVQAPDDEFEHDIVTPGLKPFAPGVNYSVDRSQGLSGQDWLNSVQGNPEHAWYGATQGWYDPAQDVPIGPPTSFDEAMATLEAPEPLPVDTTPQAETFEPGSERTLFSAKGTMGQLLGDIQAEQLFGAREAAQRAPDLARAKEEADLAMYGALAEDPFIRERVTAAGRMATARPDWVVRNGQPVPVFGGQYQPGDRPYNAQAEALSVRADDDVNMLLQGGTADKLGPNRSIAVAAAKQAGGVDGTGFVPMNVVQQQKYTDFGDLYRKANRLKQLLADPEVASSLGPVTGRYVDWTKELSGVGASTKVKEAFDLFRNLSDAELRKRSGAAISPNEYDRIVGFTVDPRKQPDSNMTNLNDMLADVERALGTLGVTNFTPLAPAQQNASPQVGDKKTFPNGKVGTWDGKGWWVD